MPDFTPLRYALPLLALLPTSALAEDLLSGELRLNLAHNSDTSVNFKRAEGSFQTCFDSPFNAQIDLGMSKFEAVDSTSPFLGLHLIYSPNDDLDIGGFVSGEDRLGTSFLIYGAELAYRPGPWGLEAYVGQQKPITTGATGSGTLGGFKATFEFGATQQWQAFGGAHFADLDSGNADSVYLGLSRDLGRGASMSARVSQHDGNATTFGIMANLTLGEGVTFNRRDWYSAFQGR